MLFIPFLSSGFGVDICCGLDRWLPESLDALRLRGGRGHTGPSPRLLVSSSCRNDCRPMDHIGRFGMRHYRLDVVNQTTGVAKRRKRLASGNRFPV